jgi:hypothetical protein
MLILELKFNFYSTCTSDIQCQDYVGLKCLQSNDPHSAINSISNPLVCRLNFNFYTFEISLLKKLKKYFYFKIKNI